MRYWSVVVAADRYDAERLYSHDCLVLTEITELSPGDRVVLVADTRSPIVFGLGTVTATSGARDDAEHDPDDPESPPPETGEVSIAYDRRMFDAPVVAPAALVSGKLAEIDATTWARFDTASPPADEPQTWLVSLDLPIEASSAAEAVRQFWSYVAELGPRELPAFVSPAGDELAMQAMVAGVEVNLEPEEDE